MRFGLLGSDPATLDLLREGVGHSLIGFYDADHHAETILNLFPSASRLSQWESMLSTSNIDGVVVAANWRNAERENQLRKLVQEQIPLLMVVPACEGIVSLEMEMIQRDTRCPIVPYAPGPDTEVVAWLRKWLGEDESRRCEQIQIQRGLLNRNTTGVLDWLARDIEVARHLSGEITRVSATGGNFEQDDYQRLAVHLEHRSGVPTRWLNEPAARDSVRFEVVTSAGKAILAWDAKNGTIAELPDQRRFEIPSNQQNKIRAWQTFARAVGQPASDDNLKVYSGATHSLEVLDATLYSVKRKRTIEMREDVVSEQATFKALMAAGGCFMLMWAFFILMLAAFGSIFERFLGFNPVGVFWLPLLIAPLGLFLAAQLLQLLFRRESGTSKT
ncbi:MAG: hypothetical protein WD045_01620 [Pirellulaceae bacterium]